jgi:hypothetical protein
MIIHRLKNDECMYPISHMWFESSLDLLLGVGGSGDTFHMWPMVTSVSHTQSLVNSRQLSAGRGRRLSDASTQSLLEELATAPQQPEPVDPFYLPNTRLQLQHLNTSLQVGCLCMFVS